MNTPNLIWPAGTHLVLQDTQSMKVPAGTVAVVTKDYYGANETVAVTWSCYPEQREGLYFAKRFTMAETQPLRLKQDAAYYKAITESVS